MRGKDRSEKLKAEKPERGFKPRVGLLPPPEHLSQAEAVFYLKRQVFEDATAAGWLKPCARKPGRNKDSIYYATRDCQTVSLRIANGEYPAAPVARKDEAGMIKAERSAA